MIQRKLRLRGYTGLLDLHVFVGYSDSPVPQNEDPDPLTEGSFHIHRQFDYPKPPDTKCDQAADECLKRFIDELPVDRPPENMLIISNDHGFRPWLDRLRARGDIVLVAHTQTSEIIRGGAHMEWNWKMKFIPFHSVLYEANQEDEDEDEDGQEEEEGQPGQEE
ncbi:unnamed protein product [Eruca vesicaria subsp. sativa]|uniref:NYN domain-containing protein n=1 Tax=Eruca vesicaria subsp. sativa TaxID=29727 RepID=A0ABC8M0V6_ERUVS|nr:unnamed protein product [Eruca vesicaria subsp. sativa]